MSNRVTAPHPNETFIRIRVEFKECLWNHGAQLDCRIFDGCQEFMASTVEGDNGALRCAVCNCQQRHHRRVVWEEIVRVGDNQE